MGKEIQVLSLHEKLVKIQSELEAPKSNYNSFGKYAYRSCEDILGALKPFIAKYGVTVTLSDEIILIGERYYVRVTATISDSGPTIPDKTHTLEEYYRPKLNGISVTAYAREELDRKGMDSAQLTGSTSSYARKYALAGLFGLDDVKDSDTTNTHGREPNSPPKQEYKPTQESRPSSAPATTGNDASEAQLRALDKMGIKYTLPISKSYASDLIKNSNNNRR